MIYQQDLTMKDKEFRLNELLKIHSDSEYSYYLKVTVNGVVLLTVEKINGKDAKILKCKELNMQDFLALLNNNSD